MPRNLTRRDVLAITTGAALAAPTALMPLSVAAQNEATTPALAGPVRRLNFHLYAFDRSPVRGPFGGEGGCLLDLEIPEDRPATLTLSHHDTRPGVVMSLPADVARELDRQLFHVEADWRRRVREKREAGMVGCPFCDGGKWQCDACDKDHLVWPDDVTARLGPWMTLSDVQPHLGRVPAAWQPEAVASPYWGSWAAKNVEGTHEAQRVAIIVIRLHGLGWRPARDDDEPDGPEIVLELRRGRVQWCGGLVDGNVFGQADTVAEALDQAVASIEGRLVGAMTLMA